MEKTFKPSSITNRCNLYAIHIKLINSNNSLDFYKLLFYLSLIAEIFNLRNIKVTK